MASPSGSGHTPSGALLRALFGKRMPTCHEIIPRLYLGDIGIATNKDEITRLGITDMITIEIKPLQASELAACVKRYLFINVMDHSKQDILSHLPTSTQFIETALSVSTNKVYVHCVAGISRSASIVIAYLMKSLCITYMEAYNMVLQKRSIIDPNEGFARQLRIYHRMKFKIDIANLQYRKVVLNALVFEFRLMSLSIFHTETSKTSGTGPSATTVTTTSSIVHLPTQAHKNLASRSNVGILFDQYYNKLHLQEVNKYPEVYNPDTAFRCNKCRAIVFYAISVIQEKFSCLEMTNDPIASASGSNNSGSGFMFRRTNARETPKECPFIFIEPQPWMDRNVMESEGNLGCYKCKRKLGKFNWPSGEDCMCEIHSMSNMSVNIFKITRKKVEQYQMPAS